MTPPGIRRIALVTDFGPGPYVGQVVARLSALVPRLTVVDLINDLPPFRPELAAYLLPALVRDMPRGTLYLCVVDPGVGGDRGGLLVRCAAGWFLGPDNGLLSRVAQRCPGAQAFRIGWMPPGRSASFHGRDWFAPAAARLCVGASLDLAELRSGALVGGDWPDESAAVVYVDRYGNLMCGLRVSTLSCGVGAAIRVLAAGRILERARTFCEVPPGETFWYENALGLLEIAVNQGNAQGLLGLAPGDRIEVVARGAGEANV